MSKYAEFEWIKRTLNSCQDTNQLRAGGVLINLFRLKYNDFLLADSLFHLRTRIRKNLLLKPKLIKWEDTLILLKTDERWKHQLRKELL